MPIRYIKIPAPIVVLDPATRTRVINTEGDPELFSFATVLGWLMRNPIWTESFVAMRAQLAIEKAHELCKVGAGIMELAEEDWLLLKRCVEEPRSFVNTPSGPQIVAGLGVNPAMVGQFVALLAPIVEAKTTP